MIFPTIQENKDLVKAVSARNLHEFLGSTERFSNWFERQLQYGFEYGVDYIGCKTFNTLARQELQDYYISIDMAKEVSMVQRTQRGKDARAYFIRCENELKNYQVKLPDFTDPAAAARAWADEIEAKQIALDKLEQAKPKINHYDRVVERKALLNATQVAQKLGMSAQRLNKMLDAAHVYNRSVKRSRVFNTWFIDKGLGEIKQTQDGYTQALFTTKGEAWAIEHFSNEEA